MSLEKVWMITGTSAGLGRELAFVILSRGDRVIGTARSYDKLVDLQREYPETFRYLQLDITDTFEAISEKVTQAAAIWGRIDVLVNNAGYSVIGTVEESGVDGLIEMYRTNVFGSVNVTNAVLPHMRACRNGIIVFIGSRSGWRTCFPHFTGVPRLLFMVRSNFVTVHPPAQRDIFDLQAIADALGEEVKPFGIKVLSVVPGGLRTSNIDHASYISGVALPTGNNAQATAEEIPEYAEARRRVREYLDMTNGTQTGDPKKAASVIADVVRGEGAAGRAWTGTLFLGSDSIRDVRTKCENTLKTIEEWNNVARSIDFHTENST